MSPRWAKSGAVRVIVVLVLAALTALATAGCGAKTDSEGSDDGSPARKAAGAGDAASLDVPSLEGKTIGISGLSTQNYFSRESYQGTIDRVKELGGKAIAVNAEQNTQKMVANHENLISQRPDAIISHGFDPKIIDPVYKQVRDAGIPLFTIDTPSPHSISNSQANNYVAGAQVAVAMAEGIGGKGNVLLFNAFSNSLRVLGIRYNMLREILKDYPDIRVLEPQLEDVVANTVEDARKKTQDALQRYSKGEIDAIMGFWDQPMIGAAQAVDAAGRDEIKVFGIDGDPIVLDLIAGDSSFYADAALKPVAIGQAAVDNAARHLDGQRDLPKTTYVDPILVAEENLEEARTELFGEDAEQR